MYNKLFTKILDSSIWLETDSTRLVWLTLIAAMDETGFAQFASAANLAHRARVSVELSTEAIARLESPDPNSSDPEHEGRRIERVPGGWMILNAEKYRELVTRAIIQEKTRLRVARFRERRRGNAGVTESNVLVTPSEADTGAKAVAEKIGRAPALPDAEWIKSIVADPAYQRLAVEIEIAKCQRWCETNRKSISRRRVINWLNRIDQPLTIDGPKIDTRPHKRASFA